MVCYIHSTWTNTNSNDVCLHLLDQLRPIAPSHLTTILELLLTNLVSRSLSYTAAPVEDLVLCLDEGHDINRKVTREVMSWFGHINEDGNWSMDVEGVIREVGLGILRSYRVRCPES